MTDGFICDGCGKAFVDAYRFVGLEIDTDATQVADFTIDDLGADMWSLVEDNDRPVGDYCTTCGREIVETLIRRFVDDD